MTALYTRYRSQRFDALVGQEAAVRTLRNAITGGRLAHAYLFTGIRGTGKTSTARILAKAVNCLGAVEGEPDNTCVNCLAINDSAATDLIEIDAASNRGVDEIRDLREKSRYLPAMLTRKVYIIDEAHQLTPEAFNALLKTLEEPPEHVLFILCTTESHKLPATIISRCQRFDFRRISATDIAGRLGWIAEQEGLPTRTDGLALLAAMAQGSMRDAITMLDQMASAGLDSIDAATVRRQLGLVTQDEVAGMLAAAARGDAATLLREVDRVAEWGADIRQLTSALAEAGRRAVLLAIGAAEPAALGIEPTAVAPMREVVELGGRGFAAAAFEALVGAASEMRQAHDPRLLLELTLLKLATGTEPAADVGPGGVQGRATVTPATPAEAPGPSAPPAAPAAPATAAAPASPAARAIPAPPAPAEPPEPSAADSTPAPGAAIPVAAMGAVPADLAELLGRWDSLLEVLPRQGAGTRVRALLKDAAPVELEGDVLTLGFRYAMLSEKAQETAHRTELEKALGQVYGRTFRLAFTVRPEVRAPAVSGASADSHTAAPEPAAVPTPATVPSPAIARPSVRALGEGETLSGERLAEAAAEILGARVTDIRTKPRA